MIDRTRFEVPPDQARRQFRFEEFTLAAPNPDPPTMLGQARALKAIDFGLKMNAHMFLVGPVGTGKTTYIVERATAWAKTRPSPPDWCYVSNFAQPDQPRAISLPAGRARKFQEDITRLVKAIIDAIRQTFESDAYIHHRQTLLRRYQDQQQAVWGDMIQRARDMGFSVQATPTGALMTVPLRPDGQPYHPQEFSELPELVRKSFADRQRELEEPVASATQKIHALEREARQALEDQDREIARHAADHLMADFQAAYEDLPQVTTYGDAILNDIVDHLEWLRSDDGADGGPTPVPNLAERYQVRVLVDHDPEAGAPVIVETNPTYANLFGRVDYRQQQGMLLTSIDGIRPGSVHRANGGFLILQAADLLRETLSYPTLKRILKQGWVRIEDVPEAVGWIRPALFQPEAIPVNLTVIVIGTPDIYYTLYRLDEDFRRLFKIKADFAADMADSPENLAAFAEMVQQVAVREGYRPVDTSAVVELAGYGATLAENQHRLSTRLGEIFSVLAEANVWAGEAGQATITRDGILRALAERRERNSGPEEVLQRMMLDGTLMIDTEGQAIGQINGLAVLSAGDMPFGRPSRITAKAYAGERGIMNIERQTRQSGTTHTKGVLTLAAFFASRFAQTGPLTLSASIAFEQLYDEVDGDSASSAELYALLSELAGVGIDQGIAVTGSVNQKGEVQPIGGVNQKIEGFFQVCRAKGLTGHQGVIIPRRNLPHLMLAYEVITAMKDGLFHVWAVDHVDEGIEILTGMPAGTPDQADTVMGRVAQKLYQYRHALKAWEADGGSDRMS